MQAKYVPREKLMQMLYLMPQWCRPVFLLMVETGVRVSDAHAAKRDDFAKGQYHYTAHKTGKHGSASVSKAFWDTYVQPLASGKYLSANPRTGLPYSRQAIWYQVKRAAKLVCVDTDGISPHSTRKTFAVDTYNEQGLGKTMHALQHRDASTTLLYALSDNQVPEIFKRLRRLEEIADLLCDRVFGDDTYLPSK